MIKAKHRLKAWSEADSAMYGEEGCCATDEMDAELTKKQEQLDINEDGKIDSEDLRRLREGEKPGDKVEASSMGLAQVIQKKLNADNVSTTKIITMGPTATFAYDWEGVGYTEPVTKDVNSAISKFIDTEKMKPKRVMAVAKGSIECVHFAIGSYGVMINLSAATVTVVQG